MAFSYELDAKKLSFLVGRFPKELAKALRNPMKKAVRWFKKKHQIARLSGRPGLNRRTGDLVRSFVPGVSPPGTGISDLESWLATRSKYAQIHEEGGTVRAAPGKALAIPISTERGGEALTSAGVLKGKYAGPLRNVPGIELIKNKRTGTAFLMERRYVTKKVYGHYIAAGSGLVPLFVLKKSVYIPPRLKFFDMFRRWTGVLKKKYFEPVLETAWKKAQKRR